MKQFCLNIFKLIYIMLNIFFLATLLIYPSEIFFATKTGLLLWYNNILPSVFAFIIGINIICASNFNKHSFHFLDNLYNKIIKIPSHILKTTILGHLAGYPLGSKLTSNLLNDDKIDKSYITLILGLSCACSPIFLISAIGCNIFSNKNIGYILIFAQFLANIITGYLYYLFFIRNKQKFNSDKEIDSNKKEIVSKKNLEYFNSKEDYNMQSFSNILSNSIINAIETVLNICGTIVFFCILIKIIQIYKIDLLFFNLIKFLLASISINLARLDLENLNSLTNTFIYGLLEITNGIYYLSNSKLPEDFIISLIAFLTTFGGACVHMQLINVYNSNTKKEPIKTGSFIKFKLISAILAFIITYIITSY